MANRYAPYKTKYITREPKTLVLKFTSNGSTGEQTLAAAPFNEGIVNVVASATGIYKVALGSSGSRRDQYSHFAGMSFDTNTADTQLGEPTNIECDHATDPNISFQVVDTDDADKYVANGDYAIVRLHFLDSKD